MQLPHELTRNERIYTDTKLRDVVSDGEHMGWIKSEDIRVGQWVAVSPTFPSLPPTVRWGDTAYCETTPFSNAHPNTPSSFHSTFPREPYGHAHHVLPGNGVGKRVEWNPCFPTNDTDFEEACVDSTPTSFGPSASDEENLDTKRFSHLSRGPQSDGPTIFGGSATNGLLKGSLGAIPGLPRGMQWA